MTLPAYVGAGTPSETSCTWPAGHAVDDYALLFVESAGGTIATPTGCVLVATCENTATPTKMSVFERFATSTSEAALALSGGTNHMWGIVHTWSGVNKSTPRHGIARMSRGSATGQNLVGTTTFLDDCMIVHALAWASDSAGPLVSSGPTNADLGSLTTRSDSGTITNNGGGVIVIDGTLATHGTIKPTTLVLTTNSAVAVVTLALQAADKTLPTLSRRSRIVNTGM